MRKPDWYCNFAGLKAAETEGTDYRIDRRTRASAAAIIAPHGKYIEPWTAALASAVAGDDLSYYSFNGTRSRPHQELHITSSHFDEPRCVRLVRKSQIVVAIHGRADREDPNTIYLGGLNSRLVTAMTTALVDSGVAVKTDVSGFEATNALNICNRGPVGGVQIELPMAFRKSRTKRVAFVNVVRGVVRDALRHLA
jgi:phage replication-related protein YjqB (UPF0714/DUF867 family)